MRSNIFQTSKFFLGQKIFKTIIQTNYGFIELKEGFPVSQKLVHIESKPFLHRGILFCECEASFSLVIYVVNLQRQEDKKLPFED